MDASITRLRDPCHLLHCTPSLSYQVKLVSPSEVRRLGKGGTLASRQAILHSLR